MRDVQLTRQFQKSTILFGTNHQIDVSRIKNLPAGAIKVRIRQRNHAFVFVFFKDSRGVHQFAIQDDGDGFSLVHERGRNETQRTSRAEEWYGSEDPNELKSISDYVWVHKGDERATLDGAFTADELEAIAVWMREPVKEVA